MKKINMFLKNKKNYGLFLVFGLALLSFVVTNNVSAATHTLTLTSSGSQSINVSASSGTAISSDSINVATTCRYGYNFTLSTSVSNNNLYLNGDISNNTSGTYFSPADGSTALNTATNTWGYYYNSNASTTPTSTSVFSPVPTLSSPATIKTPLTTPASSNINDSFKIYYGVNSAPSMSVGTYKMIPDTNNSNNDGTLVYTATIANSCIAYTVHFNPTSTATGATVTGTGTMTDQSINEGIATPLTSNRFSAPSGYHFIGWNTAQDGTGTSYTNSQSVTDLISAGNTITLYAQWSDCWGKRICYKPNGNDVVGEMYEHGVPDTYTSTTLLAPNYKRSGYAFLSWNTKVDGSGTNYGPNQTINFTEGQYSNNGLSLYANWAESAGNMQNWTGCSNMNIGDVTALKDTRDNNVYAVAKLADGKCWMTENLRLDDSATLSSSNTHNPSLPLTNNYSSNTTSNHLSPTTGPTAWCYTSSSSCINQSIINTDNTTLFINNTASGYNPYGDIYSYGNIYNWYSATAGHGKYNNSIVGYTAPGDICPSGWHIPKGGNKSQESTNEHWALTVTGLNNGIKPANYNTNSSPFYEDNNNTEGTDISNALRSYPNNYVLSGHIYGHSSGTTHTASGSVGAYWSSSGGSSNGSIAAFYFIVSRDMVYPSTATGNLLDGFMIRCIAGT